MPVKNIVKHVIKRNYYTQIDNTILQSTPGMSFKAKGILCYLLSLPPDWSINIQDICNRATEGVDAVKSGLKELQQIGYIKKMCLRDSAGKITKWVTYVRESLDLEFPPDENNSKKDDQEVVNPEVNNPEVDNPPYTNKEYKNNNLKKNNNNIGSREYLYEVSDNSPNLLLLLNKIGVEWGEKKLNHMLAKHGHDYIEKKAIALENLLKLDPTSVKNIGGYFQSVIDYDYKIENKKKTNQPEPHDDACSHGEAQRPQRRNVNEMDIPYFDKLKRVWDDLNEPERVSLFNKTQQDNFPYQQAKLLNSVDDFNNPVYLCVTSQTLEVLYKMGELKINN